jgi:hypothetical protein
VSNNVEYNMIGLYITFFFISPEKGGHFYFSTLSRISELNIMFHTNNVFTNYFQVIIIIFLITSLTL